MARAALLKLRHLCLELIISFMSELALAEYTPLEL